MARYLSEISTAAQLREARRELEIREWFARDRLAGDLVDTFTVDNLLSIVAPPGSVVERIIGGVGTGIAAVRGIFGFFGSLVRGSGYGRGYPRASSRTARAPRRSRSSDIGEIEVEVELDE
jgi:hypothetical protein